MSNFGCPGCGLNLKFHQHFIATQAVSVHMVLSLPLVFLKSLGTWTNISYILSYIVFSLPQTKSQNNFNDRVPFILSAFTS